MKRSLQNQLKLINPNPNSFSIPMHDEVQFKDIAKFLDAQMQDSIKQKLDEIDEEVEKLGKVCDNLYKKSSEEYKTILNKEREVLDNNVKKYIYNLKDNLVGLKKKINFDYKGKFLEINEELKGLSEKITTGTKQCIKFKNKIDCLNEDCTFLEEQIEDIKDMNIYLKYKLKLFLGELQEENKSDNNNDIKNRNENKLNEENTKTNLSNKSINIKEDKKSENEQSNKDDNKEKENKMNVYEDKLYLTATKNFNNSYNKKKYIKNNEFDEVEYLNSKLNLEEAQLTNYIQYEKDKNLKLIQIYKNLYIQNQNPNFIHLKDIIDEYNTTNKSKSSEANNINESNYNNSNKSIMQSINSSSLSNSDNLANKKYYTPENPGYGYINRKENKEIMLNFLESLEAKKLIYKIMYGD